MSKPLYEGLLKGEQADVQTTVYADLLKGEQADVYTYSCGSNAHNVPSLQQLPACFWDKYQALQQLLKEEESNKEDEEGGKGVEEDKKE